MNQDTLLALKDSISHWERMIACEDPYDLAERPEEADCPLCKRFRRFAGERHEFVVLIRRKTHYRDGD